MLQLGSVQIDLTPIILSVITIVFSTVSLLTLGSTKAPQREWIASSDEEAVIFDLGMLLICSTSKATSSILLRSKIPPGL